MYGPFADVLRTRSTAHKTQCVRPIPYLDSATRGRESTNRATTNENIITGENTRHLQRDGARIPQRRRGIEGISSGAVRAESTMV